MEFGLQQNLTLTQQLVMTPQLQQAIKLLQLSRLELVEMIQEEMKENPAIEEVEQQIDSGDQANNPDKEVSDIKEENTKEVTIEEKVSSDTDWESYINEYNSTGRVHVEREARESTNYEAFTSREKTLEEHLRWQLMLSGLNKTEEEIGYMIIGNLDIDGYFRSTIDEIVQIGNFNIESVKKVLKTIQGFDPSGVCARDISECLLAQIKYLGIENNIIKRIITDHLKNLENRNIKAIAKDLKISHDDIRAAVKVIQYLEPKPGRIFSPDESSYITPDIFVYKDENGYKIVLNDDGLPKLQINRFYKDAVAKNKKLPKDTKNYLNEKMQSASWLIKSIHQRQKTIYLVMESIIKFQQEFFNKGIAYLKPLILKDVALDIEMHESTISRVTTNKYAYTPQGLFELKYFFNSAIKRQSGDGELASESVKVKIQLLVKNEDPDHPLSDEKIAMVLKKANVNIARRTVAKYRKVLKILPSNKRKQL
ncbi:MAG: RNA polymerase factor sigma-54 [Desulfobacterales bacterium]|nr:RNA polymerase factor sigma-54 [Desulfobacterales bacterium]